MVKLKKLEVIKLIKEFEYVKSDYEYKSELIKEVDSEFLKSVNDILCINNELKELYDSKIEIKINKTIEKRRAEEGSYKVDETIEPDLQEDIEERKTIENPISDKVRNLFWRIAKITHPDKVDNKKLNNIYIDASKAYESDDIIQIYKICDQLDIEYNVDDEDISLIEANIIIMRERISFIENAFTWRWYNEDEIIKREMILKYIQNQLTT